MTVHNPCSKFLQECAKHCNETHTMKKYKYPTLPCPCCRIHPALPVQNKRGITSTYSYKCGDAPDRHGALQSCNTRGLCLVNAGTKGIQIHRQHPPALHKTNNRNVLQSVLHINSCYMQNIASRAAEKAHATSCAPEQQCTPPKPRAIAAQVQWPSAATFVTASSCQTMQP
jgi:hypothetical protein